MARMDNNQGNDIDLSMVDATTAPSLLRNAFGNAALDEAQVSKIHRIEAFKENAILLAGDHAQHMGVMERAAQAGRASIAAQEKKSKAAKRSADNVLFLSLLQQRSEELAIDIAKMEAGFEAKYGDAWRETIANEVLDPDEIPERRDGESMADYRERLEEVLIEKMINLATGEIRPQYANNPDTAEYAKWAKAEYDKGETDKLIDVTREIENDQELSTEEKYQRTADAVEQSNLSEAQALFNNIETGAIAEDVAAAKIESELDTQIASNDAALGNAGF